MITKFLEIYFFHRSLFPQIQASSVFQGKSKFIKANSRGVRVDCSGKAVDSEKKRESSYFHRYNLSLMPAGYSGTPLVKKLGIKPEMKIMLINEPGNYYELLEKNISDQLFKKNESPDLIHLFVKSVKEFEREMKKLETVIKKNTAISIWVSWHKKAAKIPTDVTEDVIRNYALKNDLVDVKVCAVSDIWSGLKLVVPVSKR